MGFCAQLTVKHQRYRKLAARRAVPHRDVNAEHKAILDAVLQRGSAAAVALLIAHYTTTADIILAESDLPP